MVWRVLGELRFELRTVRRDAWMWPGGAGGLALLAALLVGAGVISADTIGRNPDNHGVALAGEWFVGLWPALVELLVWVLPVSGVGWLVCAVGGYSIGLRGPKKERHFIGRLWRRRLFGILLLVLGLIVLVVAGPSVGELLAWLALLVLAVAITATPRSRARTCRWLLQSLSEPGASTAALPRDMGWRIGETQWDGRHLESAEIWFPTDLRASQQSTKDRIEDAIEWALAASGEYTVTWPKSTRSLVVSEAPPEVPLPDYFRDRAWPDGTGTVMAVATPERCTHQIDWTITDQYPDDTDPVPVLCYPWHHNDHLLITGITNGGKTGLARGLVARSITSGEVEGWWIIDGKGSADYAIFERRQGILAIAYEPPGWDWVFRQVIAEMERRYLANRQYAAGRGPKPPRWPRRVLMIEEMTNVRAELGNAVYDEYMNKLGRMVRGAGLTLVLVTQRPDTRTTVPGDIRDQLRNRAVCGWMSRPGAQMAVGDRWRAVTGTAETEEDDPPARPLGRTVMIIEDRMYRVHVPDLPSPIDAPWAEALYPPRVAAPAPTSPPNPPSPPAGPSTPSAGRQPAAGAGEAPRRRPAAQPPASNPGPPAAEPGGVPEQRPASDIANMLLASVATAGPTGRRRAELDLVAGTAPDDTRRHLDALVKAGHIVRTGSGPGTRYVLAWHQHAERADQAATPSPASEPAEPAESVAGEHDQAAGDESTRSAGRSVRRRGRRTD